MLLDVTWFPIPFPLAAPARASLEERHHIHFVGPIPVQSAADAFSTLCHAFPDRLKRIPDGETGRRQGPSHWQTKVFEEAGISHFLKEEARLDDSRRGTPLPEVAIDPSLELDTRYAHYAIASYQIFSKQKAARIIPRHVKLQISLPLPKAFVATWIKPEYQGSIESGYEAAIVRAMRSIQNAIPHAELALQIDCPLRALQDVQVLNECATRLSSGVAPDVDLGFHVSSGLLEVSVDDLVRMSTSLLSRSRCPRPITWLHLSLPSNVANEHSLLALQRLSPNLFATGTELVLGLVRAQDEEGSRRRLNDAVNILGSTNFGISASSDLAGLPFGELMDIFRILRSLSGSG